MFEAIEPRKKLRYNSEDDERAAMASLGLQCPSQGRAEDQVNQPAAFGLAIASNHSPPGGGDTSPTSKDNIRGPEVRVEEMLSEEEDVHEQVQVPVSQEKVEAPMPVAKVEAIISSP